MSNPDPHAPLDVGTYHWDDDDDDDLSCSRDYNQEQFCIEGREHYSSRAQTLDKSKSENFSRTEFKKFSFSTNLKKDPTPKKGSLEVHPNSCGTALNPAWCGDLSVKNQAESLIQFLKIQAEEHVIALNLDLTIVPHGISGFFVNDLLEFRRRRIQWFYGNESGISNKTSEAGHVNHISNSINQAFRRNGLIPEKKSGTRGQAWDDGIKWKFDFKTLAKYGTAHIKKALSMDPMRRIAHQFSCMAETLRCPLSQEIMQDPVLVPESGMSYERKNIQEWLSKHSTDPRTGQTLQSGLVIDNISLKETILGFTSWSCSDPAKGPN